ncbi:MAG: MarR family transcriptional regulator [Robiginitomaculum sp.]|nr:MAG: MarR family transcriptional regulator [Robiginitomaculum sp.]
MNKPDRQFNRNPGFLVHDLARLLRRTFDQRVRQIGLTRAQWFVLAHLYRTDGQTQRELADDLDMEPAPIGRLIDRLEESGWLRREADARDRRVKRVFLSAKILPHMEEMRETAKGVYADAFFGVSSQDFETFVDVLEAAKFNLGKLSAEKDQPK